MKNLRHPAPVFKTYPQSIIGTVPNTNDSLRHPALIFKVCTQKVLLVPFPTPMIAYAVPAPIFKIYPQSIIGTVPNINNNLRCPSAHPQTLSRKSIIGTFPNANKTYAFQRPS